MSYNIFMHQVLFLNNIVLTSFTQKHYYNVMKQKVENLDFGDVTKRQQLRQRLNCKSFKWFLETIHPEQVFFVKSESFAFFQSLF